MKLSHRDFRPQKRFKYVAQPSKRRPTIRILVLVAFGVLVYLKFDSVFSSKIAQSVLHPGRLFTGLKNPSDRLAVTPNVIAGTQTSPNPSLNLRWSTDSLQVDLLCPTDNVKECLRSAQGLDSSLAGNLRGLIHKVALQWNRTPLKGFSVHFISDTASRDTPIRFALQSLEFMSSEGPLILNRKVTGTSNQYCSARSCLDDLTPQLPIWDFHGLQSTLQHPVGVRYTALAPSVFHPMLAGQVVFIDSQAQRLKMYHGHNIFSDYAGSIKLSLNLKVGSKVEAQDTLGIAGVEGDSLSGLIFHIEKNGLYLDPRDFIPTPGLAVHADNAEVSLGKAVVANGQ